MSTARVFSDPLVSLPLPALRLLTGGRSWSGYDFKQGRKDAEEYAAHLKVLLDDDEHWLQVAKDSLTVPPDTQAQRRDMVQGITSLIEALHKAETPRPDEPEDISEQITACVRALVEAMSYERCRYLLQQALCGLYDDVPPDLVERAHRLRWEATKAKVTAEDPEFSTPKGASLLAELDALMQGQTAKDIADTATSAAEERRRYEAYVAAGGDPKDYDPSQA